MKNILNQLERKMGRHYVHDLMKYLIFAMAAVFVLEMMPIRSAAQLLAFNRSKVLGGEAWRVLTYLFLPTGNSYISAILGLYFLFFVGTALEKIWRGARFNVYYLLGYVCTLAAGFLMGTTTNLYLNMSLILCYAMTDPRQEFSLFFVLPVKAKWLGLLDGAMLLYLFVTGSVATKVVILFSLIPFFLFFGKELWLETKLAWRRLQYRINQYR